MLTGDMEETHFWTDLLECSVCLEQLDVNNKVLPCQHTFCKKCLNRIVNTHKELRCPECRVQVETKVDDLPTNILLVRLLEGIKNNPKLSFSSQRNGSQSNGQTFSGAKPFTGILQTQGLSSSTGDGVGLRIENQQQTQVHHLQLQPQQPRQQSNNLSNQEISQQKSSSSNLPRAKALFNYDGKEPGDLSFKKGDVIIIRKRIDPNWFHGEYSGKQGFLPVSYVQLMAPVTTPIPPQCKALYDFRVTDVEEKDCLSFNKGDIITVIRRVDENWAEGKLCERIGIFPITFVEMNVTAKALMKLSTFNATGPSRLAPPTPSLSDPTTSKTNLDAPANDDSSTSSPSSSTTSPSSAPCTPSSTSSSSSSSLAVVSPHPVTTLQPSITTTSTLVTTNSTSAKPPASSQSPTVYARVFIQRSVASANQKRHSLCVPPAASYGLPLAYQRTVSQVKDGSNTVTSQHRHSMEILSSETGANIFDGGGGGNGCSNTNGSNENPDITRNNPTRSSWRRETSLLETQNSVSHSPPVPVYYVAMYNYKPQKSDEVELRKGELYTVHEKCQDGWFKGTSLRTGLSGVFPGNYVQIAKSSVPQPQYSQQPQLNTNVPPARMISPVCDIKSGTLKTDAPPPLQPKSGIPYKPILDTNIPSTCTPTSSSSSSSCSVIYARPRPVSAINQGVALGVFDWVKGHSSAVPVPPVRPARSSNLTSPTVSSANEESASNSCHTSPQWHQPKVAATRNAGLSHPLPAPTAAKTAVPSSSLGGGIQEKVVQEKKDQKREKISLMKRWTSKRKSKSPPPASNGFSCDNPSFVNTSPPQNLVLRNPITNNLPTIHIRSGSCPNEALKGPQHRKSASYDDTGKPSKPSIKERCRCIVPYPPNTDYELELEVGDIVFVHRKRDDGWFKGTHQKTGKVGLFPGSFVESFQ